MCERFDDELVLIWFLANGATGQEAELTSELYGGVDAQRVRRTGTAEMAAAH